MVVLSAKILQTSPLFPVLSSIKAAGFLVLSRELLTSIIEAMAKKRGTHIVTHHRGIGSYRLKYPEDNSANFTGCFTCLFLILGGIYIILITVVNVAAVGYELVPFISSSFNGSANLWYEKLVPERWKPVTRSCEASTFALGQGCLLFELRD
jgi:hypothetical protein